MGATSWKYYTPYRPDPEEALQALRQNVFARKEYVDMTGSLEDKLQEMYRHGGQDPDSPAVQANIAEALRLQRAIDTGDESGLSRGLRNMVRRVRAFGWLARLFGAARPPTAGRPPRTIDELLEAAEESGTHSILDIEHVGDRPDFGVAAPLPAKRLRRAFGTTEPTQAQVELDWDTIAEELDRWQCRYLVVYSEGRPHQYAFIGCSGD